MAKFSWRHYGEIARIMRESGELLDRNLAEKVISKAEYRVVDIFRAGVVCKFEAMFKEDNPRFDSMRFLAACDSKL